MAPTNAIATGVWTAQSKNNAKFGRELMQLFFENSDATPMNGTRSGVLPTTGLTLMSDLLVYNVVGLTMNVAPGWGIAHRSGQGPYPGTLDAVASIACDTAPASNPRNDLVIMRMYDAAIGDTPPGGNPCRIEVITGTPAASPSDPMTVNAQGVYTGFTDGAGGVGIPLARAQVSTSGVITLTDIRKTASVVGAVRLMLPGDSDSAGRVSQLRYTIGTDLLEIKRSDGSWYEVPTGPRPRGWVGSHKPTTSVSSVGTTETVACAVTFAAVAGRRYKAQWQGDLSANGTSTLGAGYRLRWKATASQTDITGTIMSARDCVVTNTSNTAQDAFGDFVAASSGTHTVVATIRATGGTNNVVQAYSATDHIPQLLITDITGL